MRFATTRLFALRLTLTCAASSLLGGCYGYPAIATLSGSMQKNTEAWQPFVSDYVASCKRRTSMKAVIDPLDNTCDGLDEQAKQIGAATKLLDNYFGALAAVATDSKFTLDGGLDSLGGEAKKLGATSAGVDAIAALAKTVAALAAAGLQRQATGKLIAQADNAAEVVDTIESVFDTVYRDNLKREAAKWQLNMQHAANGIGMLGQPPACASTVQWRSPAPEFASAEQLRFQQFYNEQCYQIFARQTALEQFDASAEQIKGSLRQLGSPSVKLKDAEVIRAFYTQAKTLVEQAKAIDKAFNPTSKNS